MIRRAGLNGRPRVRLWKRSSRRSARRRRRWTAARCSDGSATCRTPSPDASKSTSRLLVGIFVRSLHPEKGLQVDHVAWLEIADIAPNLSNEREQIAVKRPGRARSIGQVHAIAPGRLARHGRLEEEMRGGLGDEAEH